MQSKKLISARELYFALLPDMMSRWQVAQLWLVFWFILLYFWSMLSAIQILTFNINSLINGFPQLKPCRNILCVLIVFALAVVNFTVKYSVIQSFRFSNKMFFCVMFLIVCITMLKYGVHRLGIDYHFIFEHKLSTAWSSLLKISILLNTVITFLESNCYFINAFLFLVILYTFCNIFNTI